MNKIDELFNVILESLKNDKEVTNECGDDCKPFVDNTEKDEVNYDSLKSKRYRPFLKDASEMHEDEDEENPAFPPYFTKHD